MVSIFSRCLAASMKLNLALVRKLFFARVLFRFAKNPRKY